MRQNMLPSNCRELYTNEIEKLTAIVHLWIYKQRKILKENLPVFLLFAVLGIEYQASCILKKQSATSAMP
jgi:hypothetical protein